MKKLLLLFCSLLLVTGCGKPAATLPTVIGSGSVDIPAYKITAPAAGKILGLILESGERIGKGQPLFAIEQPELDAAVEDAATEAARADAELTNLESGSGEQAIAAADYSLQSAESSYQAAEQNYQKWPLFTLKTLSPGSKWNRHRQHWRQQKPTWKPPKRIRHV